MAEVVPSASAIEKERIIVQEFIMCYKRNRVLWDSKCSKNVTRGEKDKIFNELSAILSKSKQDCTVEDVKKKINALRSNYRRALHKVRRSEVLAAQNKESIFQPTLWWYDLMHFLKDVERPFDDVSSLSNCSMDSKTHFRNSDGIQRKRKKSNVSDANSPCIPVKSDPELLYLNEDENSQKVEAKEIIFKQEREDNNQTPITECLQELHAVAGVNAANNDYLRPNDYYNNNMVPKKNGSASSSQTPHSTNSYMEDIYEPMTKNYKVIDNAREMPSSSANVTGVCDTHIYLARLWANKLTNVHPLQRLYAEKAINDIIFEAELGTLNRNSVKINDI